MTESEAFRANLLAAMREAGMNAAKLSRKAGLNARAVKDIEERRVRSPKLSTVFALSAALNRDPAEMMGLAARGPVERQVLDLLAQYAPEDRARFLAALRALAAPPPPER